ncbi:unnamed protein product, partial [Rotaria sordida]
PQLDDDDDITPVSPINKNIPILNRTISKIGSNFHLLLESDITDVFSKVSTEFLAGFSYESATEDRYSSVITFHFFTDYIETETACQWQICNKKPLTCQILVHNKRYLDEQ